MNKVYAIYYVIQNSWGESHEMQEPCYYDKEEAERALENAKNVARDPWSGVFGVYGGNRNCLTNNGRMKCIT